MSPFTRRSALRVTTSILTATAAGCASDTTETDGDDSPTETKLTHEKIIDLVSPSVTNIDDKPVRPLDYEALPRDEQRIIESAHGPGDYSVTYKQGEGPPETGKAAGLQSLINRIVDRLTKQQQQYRSNNSSDSVPEYVHAVYVRYDGKVYCIELFDADTKYYHC